MSGFNLDEYVDVAERIKEFRIAHKSGSLQSEIQFVNGGVLCIARAYRTPEDPRPGVGHAFEPIPGKTPYTKDSEVMNAETSAWGRAIVALGFETKKIASRQEVEARKASRGADGDSASGNGAGSSLSPGSPAPHKPAPEAAPSGASPFTPPAGATKEPPGSEQEQQQRNREAAGRVRKGFGGEAWKGKTVAEIDEASRGRGHLEWIAGEEFQPKNDHQKHFKQATRVWLGLEPAADPDADIPF